MELQARNVIVYILVGCILIGIGYLIGSYVALNICANTGLKVLKYLGVELTIDSREAIELLFRARGRL